MKSANFPNSRVWTPVVCGCLLCGWLVGCTVQRNTASTRLYHNLTTRYNVYYNGLNSFDEAYAALLEGLNESYAQQIAVDPIAYQIADQSGGGKNDGGAFGRSIEKAQKAIKEHSIRVKPPRKPGWRRDPKAIAEQAKTEYNAALSQAWLLLGKSQLYNADVDAASATFAYIMRLYETEAEIRDAARLWQIRCLSLANRAGEAGQIWALLDSTTVMNNRSLRPLYTLSRAEYHLSLKEPKAAISWLERAAPEVKSSTQRSRLYYLLGQLYQELNQRQAAYRAYSRVLALSPRADLDFAARIRRAELSPAGSVEVLKSLGEMSRRSKYRQYLDQIYYAMGRAHLNAVDTLHAEEAFRLAVDTSQSKGQDYALASLALGDIALERRQYLDAHRAYATAMSALPTHYLGYTKRRHIALALEALAQPAETIQREDSLLRLARLPVEERRRIIDSVIQQLKKREAEEAAALARDSIAQLNQDIAARLPGATTTVAAQPQRSGASRPSDSFYFYNPVLLTQGRREFERLWGQRILQDLWRLKKKTGWSGADDRTGSGAIESLLGDMKTEAADSLSQDANTAKLLSDDPHTEGYYLASLPLSLEAQRASEAQIETNLLSLAQLLVDRLERFDHATYTYRQILERFPSTSHAPDILYQLYLLYLRQGLSEEAEQVRLRYIHTYPETTLAAEMSAPGYWDRLRDRDKIIEAIYQKAYEAYYRGEADTVHQAYRRVRQLYPTSAVLPRLLLLSAMSEVFQGSSDAFAAKLQQLQEMITAPEDIQTFGASMLSAIKTGRPIYAGRPYPLYLSYQTPLDSVSKVEGRGFAVSTSEDRFVWVCLSLHKGTIADLLYRVATYNFTQHTQRPLPLTLLPAVRQPALAIGDFATLASAEDYLRAVRSQTDEYNLDECAWIPITQANLSLLITEQEWRQYLYFLKSRQDSKLQVEEELLMKLVEAKPLDSAPSRQAQEDLEQLEGTPPPTIPRERALAEPPMSYEMMKKQEQDRIERQKLEAKAQEQARRQAEATKVTKKRVRLQEKRATQQKQERLKKDSTR